MTFFINKLLQIIVHILCEISDILVRYLIKGLRKKFKFEWLEAPWKIPSYLFLILFKY